MSEWCEHIGEGMQRDVYHKWNFCPLCGTPRPKPEKSLPEKMEDGFKSGYVRFIEVEDLKESCRRLSLIALEEVKLVIDSLSTVSVYGSDCIVKQSLKDALDRLMEGGSR